MLYLAFVIFVVVFLGGGLMAYRHTQGREVPIGMGLAHGGAAVIGLVALYLAADQTQSRAAWAALALYLLAATGGCALFVTTRAIGRPISLSMVYTHGMVAILGCTAITVAVWAAL